MIKSSPIIYALRHGRTPWNAVGRLQGQRDIQLDDTGRAQARGNGRALSRLLGRADRLNFVSSPLLRARETMELIRNEMGLPPQDYSCDARLKEVRFGDWEGRTRQELRRECPDLLAAHDADGWNFIPPGGESYAGMSRRIDAWLSNCTRDSVMVAHGGVLRILQVLIGDAPRAQAPALPAPQDQIMIITNGQIKWVAA